MHRTRQETTSKLPIPRKGTKYIARASSHINNSVPVVIALRDMLKLANTAREVKIMIKQKLLKINHKIVKDYRESITLFSILEADKPYRLTLIPTGKFAFEDCKSKDRLCKVVNKRLISKGLIQLNLHDGTNILTKEKINVGDSVQLDSNSKIKEVIKLEKGKKAFIISGKYTGSQGAVKEIKDNRLVIDLKEKGLCPELEAKQVVVI